MSELNFSAAPKPQAPAQDKARVWSKYQEAIFNFAEYGQGNAIVEAVAGSGKSTTLEEMIRRMSGSAVYLAFNKPIADSFQARGLNARTFHSIGYSPTLQSRRQRQADGDKLFKLCGQIFNGEQVSTYSVFVRRLVSLGKQSGIGCLIQDTEQAWADIIAHHDLQLDKDYARMEVAIEMARQLLSESVRSPVVDFDDMLYLPVLEGLKLPTFDVVCIDEAQDTNAIQRAFLRKMMHQGTRIIAVGDACQPTGTQVEIVDRKHEFGVENRRFANIEDLQIGDTVTSYSMKLRETVHRRVLGISKNLYARDIVRCTTAQSDSRYTLEHQCVVRYKKGGYALYLMAKGTQFRIGISQIDHAQGTGPVLRMRQEGADAVWILKTFATRREAMVAELKAISNYNIPGTCWVTTNVHILTQIELNDIWASINNYNKGLIILRDYGRSIEHPYFIKGQQKCTLRRPHVTFAWNLMEGASVMLRDGTWVDAILSRERYEGYVYSLSVEKDEMYFADGILTHNCQAIYGFRGSDSDSLDLIAQEFNCVRLPLTVTYRCPQSVVAYAQQWVSHIEAAPGAPEGEVRDLGCKWDTSVFAADDLVVCRTTKPLIQLAYRMIRDRKPVRVQGREIGAGLKSLINKMNAYNLDALEDKLCNYRDREVQKAVAKGDEGKAQSIADKVDCLVFMIDTLKEGDGIRDLMQVIDSLFSDNGAGATVLATIHKAKGLEADNVFWLNSSLCPAQWARQQWQQQQEVNLCYVAATRAKKMLILIEEGQG